MHLAIPTAAPPACPLDSASARWRRRSRQRCPAASPVVRASSAGLPFTPGQVRQAFLAKEALFVDVRSAREFRDESLPGTVNLPLYLVPPSIPRGAIDTLLDRPDARDQVPMNTEFEEKLSALVSKQGTNTRVLFLCSNGKRSSFIASALAADGAYQAAFMVGGLHAWLSLYSPAGVPRKRATAGVFKDTSGRSIWTDSAEEDTVLPARGGNENDLPDEEPRNWGGAEVVIVSKSN
jgi:rhodanese-related sulfurtransferase